ncbi:MAG: hypothetical protein HYT62_02850 [Candidatus Yanofskybacteria bacterium]|nr:hypothetical protein [Candidatus Yanofskybacteria bacterium]
MGPKLKLIFISLFLIAVILLFAWRIDGQTLDILPARALVIEAVSPPSVTPHPLETWNFTDKLKEAEGLVASSSLDLKVSKNDIVYYESRISRDNEGRITGITRKKMSDPEREIALVLVDINSGDLELIKITERGNNLTYPNGYEIENVERPSGITNNAWNTCRRVIQPDNKAIILNVWPHYVTKRVAHVAKNKKGKLVTTYKSQKFLEKVVYTPYCDQIHIPEFVGDGKKYRKSITEQAFAILRDKQVQSKAFPGTLVADVEYLRPEYFEMLPLVEHMDYGEFSLDPRKSAERVDVILGTNMSRAYSLTCSKAKACGALQYTKATWNSMDKKYPAADLPIFELGVANHVISVSAAILLFDNNLAAAIKEFGTKILDDPDQLSEMLYANYNGGTVRPYKSYKASILKSLEDWLINPMRAETKQYIEKYRYVRENYN